MALRTEVTTGYTQASTTIATAASLLVPTAA